ncbi:MULTISPECIES: hypothetical protein [unclassified Pseudofrankia]|uniref:hypothetical protein n=1 Tax=unclassified Pseudofrankia TaxID=2994372 RepID=UPI0008D8FB32|nr:MULTISPECIES: hypothetical protein [unclassified Pseudofrankia]MDT3445882.1 hypothetical protein [Pseudofrankia sp. BMG5.37]OHV50686.1 hypothetical protein BCD48_10430 [Pseudofrankia sp. BMG5.36]
MPSGEHESTIEAFEQFPELPVWLLERHYGVKVRGFHHAVQLPTEVRQLVPATYHADAMALYCDAANRPLLAAVLEVQRTWDARKRWRWKEYICHLEKEKRVSAALVVYCPRPAVARRYRRLFETEGVSLRLRPFIFTPDDVPLVVDPGQARTDPAVALLSMLWHRTKARQAFPALAEGMQTLSPEMGEKYHEIVLAGLPEALRSLWEDYMATMVDREYRSKIFRDLQARGKAEGKVEALLTILEIRRVHVPDDARERIRACTDLDQLGIWLRRAVTATTLDDVIRE